MNARRTTEAADNPLGPMVSAKRGLTPERALAEARTRVRALGERSLADLDRRLGRIVAFAERPETPLRAEDLRGLRRHAEAALTACGGLDRPWLGRALLMLSAQSDALCDTLATSVGTRDALGPAVRAVALLRYGRVSDAEAALLLEGLGRCLDRFLSDAACDRPDSGAATP